MLKEHTPVDVSRPRARPGPHAGLRGLLLFFAALAILVAASVVLGLLPRLERQKGLVAASRGELERRPVVNVAAVRVAPATSELELPGDLQALIESPLFARADGYLRKRLADIGDRVKAGQELAEIETPELDQQIREARATLSQSRTALKELQAGLELARANLKLARVTLERWQRLADSGVFSRQDADEKQASFEVRQAQVQAAEASLSAAQDQVNANEARLRRLEEMKSFAQITAPFDGIVTARNVDVGTLINAGNAGPARELFRVAQIQILRIFVNVPQTHVSSIHPGQTAALRVPELPGRVFPARVTRTTQALDANSRAMLAILEVPNPRAALLPGMYAQVRFAVSRAQPALLIPGDALVLAREGPRVAVVAADQRVHYRKIHIGHDYGAELEVDSGLSAGELVVVNPTDAVRENTLVELRNATK